MRYGRQFEQVGATVGGDDQICLQPNARGLHENVHAQVGTRAARRVANDPAHATKLGELKLELARVKKEAKDDDQFADKFPKDGVDAANTAKPLGVKTIAEAISASASK